MKSLKNKFKKGLKGEDVQFGIWNGIADTIVGEILAGSGFDWILIDGEHAPFDLRTIQLQLQALGQFDVSPIVRPPVDDQNLIKQLLDIGVQSLLIPNVESAEQAAECVKYMRYAPEGVRGVGTGLARAAQWNRVNGYFQKANNEMCLVVQVESVKGVENLDAILEVDNLDGVFIGPADLAASMGYLGQSTHPKVVDTICECITKIEKSNKAAGVITFSKEYVDLYISKGARMVGVGIDLLLLAKAAKSTAEQYKAELKNIGSNTIY